MDFFLRCEWDISEPEASTTTSTTKLSTPYYTMLSEISTGTTLMDKQKATGVDQLLLVICPLTIVIFLICTSILVYFIKKMRTKNDQQENIVMQEINP
jgi:heme/copper-type cytochrome/quinol oxidase subunit 2